MNNSISFNFWLSQVTTVSCFLVNRHLRKAVESIIVDLQDQLSRSDHDLKFASLHKVPCNAVIISCLFPVLHQNF